MYFFVCVCVKGDLMFIFLYMFLHLQLFCKRLQTENCVTKIFRKRKIALLKHTYVKWLNDINKNVVFLDFMYCHTVKNHTLSYI